MNPDTRTMTVVRLEDENALLADEIFTVLMGEKVEPLPRIHHFQRQIRGKPRFLNKGEYHVRI